MMENAEEVMQMLEHFSKMKPQVIPRELDEYLGYVAKTGNPLFKWSLIKNLFREKMLNVINDFYEDTMTIDLPSCPNVDAFNYERMKSGLMERLDAFHGAPFTVQRLCELLTNPRKEYNRADKFMRAIEKNLLVVSTREPERYSEIDCESTQECSVNGIQENNDALDATFTCNDLSAVPVSSSHNLEIVDTINTNASHGSVPMCLDGGEKEVSSDADEISNEQPSTSTEHNQLSDKLDSTNPPEVVNNEEQESSKVTSSNVYAPIDSSIQEPAPSDLASSSLDADTSSNQDFGETVASENSQSADSADITMEATHEATKEEPTSRSAESELVVDNVSDSSETSDATPAPSDESSTAPECDQTDSNDDPFTKNESSNDSSEANIDEPKEPKEIPVSQDEESQSYTEVDSQVQRVECDISKVDETQQVADTSEASSDSNVSDSSGDNSAGRQAQPVEIPEPTPSEDNSEQPSITASEDQPPAVEPESEANPVIPAPTCQPDEPMEIGE